MARGDAPDWNVHAMDKAHESFKARVGSAWNNSDGTIGIVLNPFVTLEASPSLTIRLFPTERASPVVKPVPVPEQDADDIPF